MVIEVDYSSDFQNSSKKNCLNGWYSKMFPDCSTATVEKISKFSYRRWMNSGMVFRGEFWMQNTLEHPSGAEGSSLSEVLEISAPPEYFLNVDELNSLLKRAEARSKPMEADLENAMMAQVSILSNMPQLDENPQQDHKEKDTEVTEKPTHSTQEDPQTLYVRRMMASEYEKLQGFPEGWTRIDTEQ